MPLSPDRRLQLRIAGAFALVVGVNAAVLALLAWCGLQVWLASGRTAPTAVGPPLVAATVLVGGIVTVLAQARYGSRSAVAGLGVKPVDGRGPRDVTERVTRLARQADVPAPSVAVADSDEPTCLTVAREGSPTIVVTTGLLDRLDDDELDAALAHEIGHVANRDLPLASAVAATLSITDRLLEREGRLRVILYNAAILSAATGVGILLFAIPIAVLALFVLVLSVAARTLLAVNAVALRTFARTREYAADRAAASLTGDPASLAGALRTLDAEGPDRDLRMTAGATLGIVHRPLSLADDANEDGDEDEEGFVERFLLDPDEENEGFQKCDQRNGQEQSDPVGDAMRWLWTQTVARAVGGIRRALRWRPSTHPGTAARIDRLRTLERRDG
jgi:heat shock protein HtpX